MSAVALIPFLLVAGGCASADGDVATQKQAPSELIYRTGSNIPVRDAKPVTKEERDRQAEEAQRALSSSRTAGTGGGLAARN